MSITKLIIIIVISIIILAFKVFTYCNNIHLNITIDVNTILNAILIIMTIYSIFKSRSK